VAAGELFEDREALSGGRSEALGRESDVKGEKLLEVAAPEDILLGPFFIVNVLAPTAIGAVALVVEVGALLRLVIRIVERPRDELMRAVCELALAAVRAALVFRPLTAHFGLVLRSVHAGFCLVRIIGRGSARVERSVSAAMLVFWRGSGP